VDGNRIQFDMVTNVQQTLQALGKVREEAAKIKAQMADMKLGTASVDITKSVQNINSSLGSLEKQTHSASSAFEKLGQNMKHHLSWAASGAILGGLIGIPYAIQNIAKETEALTAKQRQNLELADKYHNNSQLLEQDLKRMNDIIAIYAVGYGESLTNVGDAAQLILRRFKDVDQASYILSAALTMAKIDNVDLMTSTQNLESVMLQFQLDLDGTRKFVNSFTTAVHISKIAGEELLQSLQRSGGSFKQFNMGVDESIAAVAALATETSRTGSTIGQTYKSVAANFSMPKAIEALDAYGIKLYEVNENGMKVQRKGANVFQELQALFGRLDAEGQAKLALAISGGKYQVNAMLAFLQDANGTFSQILNEIQTKSSDALTAQLLRMGLQTYQIKLMQLEASMQVFGKTIGDTVLPELKNMIDGLTNGVIWLTENKEAVGNTVTALVELGKVVTAFYISQGIANAAIKEGTVLLRVMYLMEGNFKTAFYGMGGSLKTFGAIAASVTVQMAALYAAINVISAAYDRLSDKSGLTAQQQDLSGQIAMIEGNRKFAIANKARTGMSEDEINAIYDSQISELQTKLNTINEQKQAKENEATKKAGEESERAFKAIVDRAMAAAQVKTPDLSNMIPEKEKSAKGSASNNVERTDQQLTNDQRLWEAKNKLRLLNLQIATDNDRYKITQDKLSVSEAVYGNTLGNILAKETARNARIQEFSATWEAANQLITEHTEKINDLTDSNAELNAEMETLIPQWKSLSKADKWQAILDSDQLKADVKLLRELIRQIQELEQIKSKAHVDAEGIRNDIIKNTQDKTGDPEYQFQRRQKSLADRINGELAKVDKSKVGYFYDELAIKVNGLRESNALLNARLKEQQEILRKTSEKDNPKLYQETSDAIDALNLKIAENGAKTRDIAYESAKATKEFWAGTVSDMVINGNSLKDVMKSIWGSIAKDAINAMFRIEQKSTTLGTMSGGKGKGTKKAGDTTSNTGKGKAAKTTTPTAGKKGKVGKNAQGSIGNQEQLSWIREGNKREAIIPLEDHKDRGRSLWTQAGVELGMFNKGTDVVPYMKNPELAKDSSINVQVQQSEKHLEKLDKQNELMLIQNKMMFQMLTSDNGKTTVAQPIVMQQSMSMDELYGMLEKMKAMGYKM